MNQRKDNADFLRFESNGTGLIQAESRFWAHRNLEEEPFV